MFFNYFIVKMGHFLPLLLLLYHKCQFYVYGYSKAAYSKQNNADTILFLLFVRSQFLCDLIWVLFDNFFNLTSNGFKRRNYFTVDLSNQGARLRQCNSKDINAGSCLQFCIAFRL